MIRLIIADSHPITRLGIRSLCENKPGFRIIADCDLLECVQICQQRSWDVLVLGLGYPAADGLEVLAAVKFAKPSATVLVFSLYPEEEFAMRVLTMGGSGYLTKQADLADIPKVLHHVARGERYVPPDFASRVAAQEGAAPIVEDDRHPLTPREHEVLMLLAEGHSTAEIAKTLAIGTKTVYTLRSRICTRLKLHTLADIITYARSTVSDRQPALLRRLLASHATPAASSPRRL